MPLMSDEEAFGSPPATAQASGGLMSDEEAFKAPAAPAKKAESPSFSTTLQSELNKTGERGAEALANPNNSAITPALVGANTGFGVLGDYPKAAAETAYNYLPEGIRNGISSAANAVSQTMGKPAPYGTAKAALPDTSANLDKGMAQFNYEHPDIGQGVQLAGNAASVLPIAKGISALAGDAGNAAQGVNSRLFNPNMVKSSEAISEAEKNYNFVNGINKSIDSMRGVEDYTTGKTVGGYGAIYDKAGEASNGVVVSAPKAQETVSNLLDDMKNDVAHKTEQGSSQAYRDLEAVNASFDEHGNIPLDKVTLLKRRLNDLYSPDMGETRGAIYSRLNNQVNTIIKQARVENPEWGALMDSGNGLFNNYRSTTDSLSDLWGLGDKKEYESALKARQADPNSAPPTAGVRQKINTIAQPASVQQFEDAMRVIPKDMQADYTASVIANNPSNSRIANAAKTVYKASYGNKIGAANSAIKTIVGNAAERIDPETATAFPHVEDAIDLHSTRASLAHDAWLQKNAPKPPLLLTDQRSSAPQINVPANFPGHAAPVDPTVGASPNTVAESRPSVQAAQDIENWAGKPSLYEQNNKSAPPTPPQMARAIQAGMPSTGPATGNPARYAAVKQRNLEAWAENEALVNKNIQDSTAWHENDVGGRQKAVESIYNQMRDAEFGGMSKKEINDHAMKLVQNEISKSLADPLKKAGWGKNNLGAQIKGAFQNPGETFSRGGTSEWDTHAENMRKLGHDHDQIIEHLGARPKGFAKGGAVNVKPTEAQKASGNYKKDHIKLHGLDISIENPKGSERTGTGSDGKVWKSPAMPAHYGYIRGTVGADSDHVDCFIGDNAKSKRVYVIDQKNDDGKFDEHKCVLNCTDRDEAVRLYKGSFSDKKNRIMKVTRMTIPEFKDWLKHGNTRKPVAA